MPRSVAPKLHAPVHSHRAFAHVSALQGACKLAAAAACRRTLWHVHHIVVYCPLRPRAAGAARWDQQSAACAVGRHRSEQWHQCLPRCRSCRCCRCSDFCRVCHCSSPRATANTPQLAEAALGAAQSTRTAAGRVRHSHRQVAAAGRRKAGRRTTCCSAAPFHLLQRQQEVALSELPTAACTHSLDAGAAPHLRAVGAHTRCAAAQHAPAEVTAWMG